MKVLLVKPRNHHDSIQPVMGLLSLATAVRRNHEVEIFDPMTASPERGLEAFRSKLRALRPDLVGIQVYSTDVAVTRAYLGAVRSTLPGALTCVGGPHPTAATEETLSEMDGALDYAFRGEAEISLPRFLEEVEERGGPLPPEAARTIPGLAWKEAGGFRANDPTFLPDLDSLGLPAWDLMPPDRYPPAPHGGFYRQRGTAPVIISRGCPYECTFCAAPVVSTRKLRYRRIEAVMQELDLLRSRFGVREVHVVDDNFTLRRDYVLDFCRAIGGKGFTWCFPNGVRLEKMDREVMDRMREAGCYSLSVGIESGSPRILRMVDKQLDLGWLREKLDEVRAAHLDAVGFFILGFPTESRDEMRSTLRLSRTLPLRRANFMLFRPLPGTRLYQEVRSNGADRRVRWEATSYAEPCHVPEGMTPRGLKWIQRRAFLGFYLRPKHLADLVRDIRSPRHAWYVLRRIWRWMVAS